VTGDTAKANQTIWPTATRESARHRPRAKPTGQTTPIDHPPLSDEAHARVTAIGTATDGRVHPRADVRPEGDDVLASDDVR
jgi:hypothetical protein